MCFIRTKESKLLIAKRDITVYKVGVYADVQMFTPYFMTDYCYRRKALANQTVTFNKNSINIGLHSVLSLEGCSDYGNRQDVFIVSDKTNLSEGYSSFISLDLSSLTLSMGYRTCFFKKDLCKLRLATDSEKKQLFSALEKEGKVWDAEKKMIVNLKPKVELKPFDNVLVRHQKTEEWRANIFSHTDKTDEYLDYVCVNGRWEFCIPYEGNESLLGTTKDVED